jgi:hypothetical protein
MILEDVKCWLFRDKASCQDFNHEHKPFRLGKKQQGYVPTTAAIRAESIYRV